jgi:tetratricopeptide (TPR) repeat protein
MRFLERLALSRRNVVLLTSVLLGAAYSTSFCGVFLFDDCANILYNTDIRSLWPPWKFHHSEFTPGRALVGLTLAVNYAISGYAVWSYHVLNWLAHVVATLALYGIIRRALLAPGVPQRFAGRAGPLALLIALLWGLHPLQTEAVTYIIQRAESLMGLFFLLTLYALIRADEADRRGGAGGARWWQAAAVAACWSSALCKAVAFSLPLVALLFDRAFLSGSWGGALRRRWPLHLLLAGAWLILIPSVQMSFTATSAGFTHSTCTPWQYALTQCRVLFLYLRLSLAPAGLCLDYDWPTVWSLREVWPWAVSLAALLLAALLAVLRRPKLGFAAAWFFIILGPTSSFMPILDRAVEHRMYLSLAGVLALAVLAADDALNVLRTNWGPLVSRPELARRLPGLAACAALLVLGGLTLARNLDYRKRAVMWADVVSKRPENQRAQFNLANALYNDDRYEDAAAYYQNAVALKPRDADALVGMGQVLVKLERSAEGIPYFLRALEKEPGRKQVQKYLGEAYVLTRRGAEAVAALEKAAKEDGEDAETKDLLNKAREIVRQKMEESRQKF